MMKLDLSCSVWVLAVALLLLVRITAGSILGAAVNIELLEQDRTQPVRAHYSAVSSLPCPALNQLCKETDCMNQLSSSPLTGALPSPGWCLHQWKKNIPEQYTSALQLRSNRSVLLQSRADLSVRADTNRVNQPPYVALPPPVRLQAACPQEIPVNVMDLDGDEIRCRYKNTDLELLQLNEETCMLLYEGGAPLGQYSVLLMVEDFPQSDREAEPFSTVPVHLLITVESGAGCSVVPQFSDVSPAGGSVIHVLPFEEVHVNITVDSRVQSVSEIAVTGPPGLFKSPMEIGQNFQSSVTLSWVQGPNQFAHLVSICFAANTQSLQSNIRCIWLQQTQTDPLPPGTELKCKEHEMSLVLPLSFLENVHFSALQLNDPTCPVFYNWTHVTASFPLTGCGTKRMHFGSELLYTNTLRSINPNSTISRMATLILPLACRIPAQRAKGPAFKISIPEEVKTFGAVSFWLEFHLPGMGPMSNQTRLPSFRGAPQGRAARSTARMDILDLHVFSNCSLARAELLVGSCVESETEDFANTKPLLNQGCTNGNGTLEILTSTSTVRIFRLYLSSLSINGDTMYVECVMHLCVTTKQTDRCPDPCSGTPNTTIIESILTHNYTVRSGPVSLIKVTENSATTAKPQSATPVAQPSTSQSLTATASRSLDTAAFWVITVSLLVVMHLP
ncbi:uncharacterized protein LOC122335814 [Puntigrus tetrazona]|uniref:uncharacterized protein LOC122335814 n=1 Tax=Puntigrus tetrazona TaxID=1606681 RepID=UPI001C8A034F|nr:uncharacterized protein LOC122335814 [Puntigrus tetrazona]